MDEGGYIEIFKIYYTRWDKWIFRHFLDEGGGIDKRLRQGGMEALEGVAGGGWKGDLMKPFLRLEMTTVPGQVDEEVRLEHPRHPLQVQHTQLGDAHQLAKPVHIYPALTTIDSEMHTNL